MRPSRPLPRQQTVFCHFCGKPYPAGRGICPVCKAREKTAHAAPTLRVVNIEKGMPSVEDARTLMNDAIAKGRKDGVRVLKIIHGYGSSGVGGALRIELRKMLATKRAAGAISEWIPGEEFSTLSAEGAALLRQFPKLRTDADMGRRNQGMTLVVL